VRARKRLPLEQLAPYLLEAPHTPEAAPLDLAHVFGNANPVELEVGFGKGLFLQSSAETHPDVNYLGIEILRKYQLWAATRLAKRGLHNVRLACADARAWLRRHVADGALRTVHVYFPDPWWKTRHRKRRLFTGEFVKECERCLRPGGQLHLATDVEDYFGVMTELIRSETRLRPVPVPEAEQPLTNFERKYRLENRPIYRAWYEKQVPSDEPN
jgi:tRNA (guanine-N7-)-methyltransferase